MTNLTIRAAGYQGAASVHTRALDRFAHVLLERLGSTVNLEIHFDITKSGRSASDLLRLVEEGELSVCYFSASYLADRAPPLGVFDLPFAFESREDAYAMVEEAGPAISDALAAATDFRLLAVWDNGFRHLTNRSHVIRHPDDCVGLRLRTLASVLHGRVFGALGFEPVAVDVRDLKAAVASGEIDAQENPLTNICGLGIPEHHPYLTLSGHFWGAALLLVHAPTYAGWPFEVRSAIDDAAAEATSFQRRLAADEYSRLLGELEANGHSITRLSATERFAFRKSVASAFDEALDALAPSLPIVASRFRQGAAAILNKC